MERYDNIVKIEEIRKLTDEGQYGKAVRILDTMDLHRIKSLTDLSILADVLTENGRFEEAMELLSKIYEKSKTRRVLYQIVELSIKRGEVSQAEEYLLKYIQAAPKDSYRFIFRFYIDKLKGEPYEVLIESLEQLKEYEYIEVWAYELAKLYHKAGLRDKCVRECSDITLWFGDGIYVEKAKLLKAYYVGEIDPVHILKAKDKNETRQRLGLDKTKDYRNIRDQINEYLAEEESEDRFQEPLQTEDEAQQVNREEYEQQVSEVQQGNKQESWQQESEPQQAEQEKSRQQAAEPQQAEQEKSWQQETELQQADQQEFQPQADYSETDNLKNSAEDKLKEERFQEIIKPEDKKAEIYNSEDVEADSLINQEEESGQAYAAEESVFSLFDKVNYDYRKELEGFLQIEGMKEQLRFCLENILSDASNNKFMVISGEAGSGKTSLALKICKGLYLLNWIKTNRIAKITGENLNRINIMTQKEKLYGSSLIIERPGCINSKAAEELHTFLNEMESGIFVILEGTKEEISGFLSNYPALMKYFPYELSLTNYSLKQLFVFARQYLESLEYKFREDSKEEFMKCLEIIAASDDGKSAYGKTMQLAARVRKAAEGRYMSLLGDILNNGNLTKEDLLYIIKEDITAEEVTKGVI